MKKFLNRTKNKFSKDVDDLHTSKTIKKTINPMSWLHKIGLSFSQFSLLVLPIMLSIIVFLSKNTIQSSSFTLGKILITTTLIVNILSFIFSFIITIMGINEKRKISGKDLYMTGGFRVREKTILITILSLGLLLITMGYAQVLLSSNDSRLLRVFGFDLIKITSMNVNFSAAMWTIIVGILILVAWGITGYIIQKFYRNVMGKEARIQYNKNIEKDELLRKVGIEPPATPMLKLSNETYKDEILNQVSSIIEHTKFNKELDIQSKEQMSKIQDSTQKQVELEHQLKMKEAEIHKLQLAQKVESEERKKELKEIENKLVKPKKTKKTKKIKEEKQIKMINQESTIKNPFEITEK